MSRPLLLIVLVSAMLFLGLATLHGGLLVLMIPPLIYLAAALLHGPKSLNLEVHRSLDAHRVSQDTPIVVRLSITNKGSALETVTIRDHLPASLELQDGDTELFTSLSPGETIALEYTVRGKRGAIDFQDVRVRASDHLDLLSRDATLSTSGHITILPEIPRLRRVMIRPLRTLSYVGPVPARRGGSGVEFFGVRDYQPGDSLRWINWRASARHIPDLFSNEFERERITDVGLILDARERTNVQSEERHLFEYAVRATASLADTFLNDGNRVGLLVYGGFLDWTFPGYGKVQRERILRTLARAETGESMVFENLDYIPTRRFPARSQIVMISPLCRDDLQPLIRLCARGYEVLVVSPDPVTFEADALPPRRPISLATRIARLERALLLHKIRRAGIRTVDWQVNQPFDRAIHTSLSRQPRRSRAIKV
ncbi:MAG: DUF58 domain-containing protein [Anaerolineales bacterium]